MPKLLVVSRLHAALRSVAALFVLCAVPAVAHAVTIIVAPPPPPVQTIGGLDLVVLVVDRQIDAQGTSYCPGCGDDGEDTSYSYGESLSNDQPGLFDDYVVSVGSSADQNSMVSNDALYGEGGIGLGATGDNSGYSSLSVIFRVRTSGTYGVLGEFDVYGFVDVNYIELTGSSMGEIFHHDGLYGPETFQESFQLVAGEFYTLRAEIEGYDYSGTPNGGSWSFTFVPEPGTGTLLATGLVGLAARRRRPAHRGRSTTSSSSSFATS